MSETTKHVPTANDKAAKALFPTPEAAKGVQPDNAKFRLYAVSRGGNVIGYTWEVGAASAIENAARADGYSAAVLEKAPADPAKVVATLTDEQLKALGLKRVKPRVTREEPAAEPAAA